MATAVSRKTSAHKLSSKTVQSGGILGWIGSVITGVLIALIVTVVGVAAFALVIRWVAPSNTVVSVINQALKLIAIAAGVWFVVRKHSDGGLLKGALIGFVYMLLGVVAYSLLSDIPIQLKSYLADLGMGVAGGGLCGMILPGLGKRK
ncbi:MAG: TIGR04086 family membrane protein [Oscillospiraceae bacterium]|jgi:putative membrane protein (TIGR04086 family)|nr:TIGR04086 family membrane protein [Oscillospiraceae bacterium]